jgi:hypothetical protein
MDGEVEVEARKSADILRQKGFQGNVTVYCSPKIRTQIVSAVIAKENGYSKPIGSEAIGLDDGEKSGRVFWTDCEKNGIAATLGHTGGGMLVLVTHEPVIKAVTGRKQIDYGEVVVLELP